MYAIIRDGSRQFRVEKGLEVEFALRPAEPGEKVEFKDVLLVNDGSGARIGTPTVAGAKVLGEVVSKARGEKLRVFKYRRRTGDRRALGHRQCYTLVKITDIVSGS